MNEKLLKKLRNREEKGTKRSLSSFEGMIDLHSNDYLGFSGVDFEIRKESDKGATGSRLISGNNERLEELESQIASFFNYEAGLFFNSGYDANLGVFSSIPQRGDVVLYDEHVHASIRDGIRLSFADSYSFRHNDIEHLESRLKSVKADNIYIAIEGLYSMNGDIVPLKDIDRIAHKYGALVILDEAHSAGIIGEKGRGVLERVDNCPSVILKLVTFGKAFGGHGAIVLSNDQYREYLINFARSFIYTTGLPNSGYEKVLKILGSDLYDKRRVELKRIIERFNKLFSERQLDSDLDSPIKIIAGLSVRVIREIEKTAHEKGIAVKGIFSPTVPEGDECLRVSLHSFNTEQDLNLLKELIKEA